MFVEGSHKKKMEEQERQSREEEEQTMRRKEEEENAKLRESWRGGMAMGSLMLGVVGEELARGEGWG
jgi:hypothetical protein